MKVCEIFTSIQGETSHAGLPCTFIRMTGCNLRCSYCDTVYAYEGGEDLSEDKIMDEVSLIGVNLVEITGGEPLLQNDVLHLIARLSDEGYKVLLETNGTMSIKDVDRRAIIILDVKTPGSGMSEDTDTTNFDYLKPEDEIKFVITDKKDYEWARNFLDKDFFRDKSYSILFSPAYGLLQPDMLARWILKDRLNVRLNIQIHKYIYGHDTRAV